MERCIRKGGKSGRCDAGGILSLAKFIGEHREAVEYDLLTCTGFQIADVGSRFKWSALRSFLLHAGPESAILREVNPEASIWGSRAQTNTILADIFDMLANINANLIAIGTKKPAKRVKPYPRPVKKEPENEQHIGSGAMPAAELRKWFEEKR